VKPYADESDRDLAEFTIVFPVVYERDRRGPLELAYPGEVDAMFRDVGAAFGFVPLVSIALSYVH